ncbi:kinesin-like protein KIFC2 isoform X1 [Leopardus geoffroyi]|uniref:kinesin-like protein KIFC2 isoform X1 n=1 Tax=Felis catus TaxID=9685 RepID=UPI0009487B69|nr:kinesin-like protein KIFC2 isoform X1 [Felis catus]XP_040350710.1 kinesin-like protein KIFC2 isoform X2 [Puma yagouaroundi]XP_045311462.1 kinesin-like protein KIFC2 isoform X1 [Leopardus geoffroyi]
MYAFYSLLIYIFYSLFRRDGGAAVASDPGDPAQSAGGKPGGRRRPDQPTAELWTELTGLVGLTGCSESEDGPEEGAEGRSTEVSLEEALVRLAEFLSVQLGAEESCRNPDLSKPSDVPPLLTVTGQLLALLAWIRSPRGRQALPQGIHPASEVQPPTPAGSPPQEESPSLSPRGEAQGQNPPQLEEDQRAWQRLEQLILGQLEELKQQLELQEEELGRLRLGVGATDSEKRVQHLTLENEALKQSLSLTRDLLLHWGPGPSTRAPQEEAEALVELQSRLQEAQDTTEALQVQLGVQEVQLQGLRGALRQLQQETEQNCRRELQQMLGQLAGLRARMASLRQGCGDLRGLVSTFTQSCQCSLSEARGQVSWALGALSAGGAGTQLPEEQQGPPTGCPGRLLELKGNIRVLCRLRPGTPSSLVSLEPGPSGTVTTCYRGRQRRFRLDWVFSPEASQEEKFPSASPHQALQFQWKQAFSDLTGRSSGSWSQPCCPASKATVSAFSPTGPPEDPGIAPRALQSLFQEMGTEGQHRVTLSMVEIYNEAVRDLLAPGPPERLAVRQGPAGQGGIQVAGLTYWDVPDLEMLHQMLSLGRSNRATAATTKNPHSSRSHALVTLTLRTASPPRGPGTAGTLHLVDLAGSERAWKAGAAGPSRGDRDGAQRLREARTINRSLLALGGVMAALRARRPHVPFRDSQLTRLLQPALGPGATAVLLLQISTRPEDLGETVCSLKFAERVGRVELGPARRCRAPRSGTPSSLSTDTPLTGTPCTPTPSPGSPPGPGPGSGSSSGLGTQKDAPL